MSAGRPVNSDGAAIRRASRAIGWQITIAAAVIVLIVVLVAIVVIVEQQQPRELLERPRPGQTKIYVDAGHVLVVLVVLGVAAIAVAGLLSFAIARRAVRPLGDALRIQRTFVADASHELRTPLSVLDARIQSLQRRLPPDDSSAEAVAAIRRDTRVLIDVVGDLLLAAGAESTEPGEPSDVHAVVAEAADGLRLIAARHRVAIVVSPASQPLRTIVPATSLRRCVVALLDNAIAWSPEASTVTVTVALVRGQIELTVADQGPGINGIEPERVFDRFAHTASPQPGRAPARRQGFGIGLALVREIALRYGGSVQVRSTGPEGTTFLLSLPSA